MAQPIGGRFILGGRGRNLWRNTLGEIEVVLSNARANIPPSHPQLVWQNSCDRDCDYRDHDDVKDDSGNEADNNDDDTADDDDEDDDEDEADNTDDVGDADDDSPTTKTTATTTTTTTTPIRATTTTKTTTKPSQTQCVWKGFDMRARRPRACAPHGIFCKGLCPPGMRANVVERDRRTREWCRRRPI